MNYVLQLENKNKYLLITGTNGTVIKFNIKSYSINNLRPNVHNSEAEAITKILNDYLASQPDDAVTMNALSEAYMHYSTLLNTRSLVENTTILMYKFINTPMFNPATVAAWVKEHVTVPSTFNETYTDNPNHTREQTYLASDYLDLVVLAIYMKALIPITAAYLNNLSDMFDKATYEIECLKVIPDIIKGLPGYKMLYQYTGMVAETKSINPELLLKREIPSERQTDWLFSLILIKRIVSGTVYNNAESQTLVSYIYRQIKNKSDLTNTSFNYKDKCVGAGDAAETADTSVLEKFRYKDKTTVSLQVQLQTAVRDEHILHIVGDAIDHNEYKTACARYIKQAPSPDDLQVNLCKMILMPYISHHALWLITQEELLRKLMLAHCIIREKHPLIALLVIAHRESDERVDIYLRKNKLSPDLTAELKEVYPYCKVKGEITATTKQDHIVISTLEDIVKAAAGWNVYLPLDSSTVIRKYVDDETVLIPTNIREMFARFFLDIDTLTD